jgi:tetratricopeptide (TPR) repeat protein
MLLGWVGAGLLFVSPLLGWMNPPLQGMLRGHQIPILLSEVPTALSTHSPLFSFGAVACLMGGMTFLSLLLALHRIRLFLGGLALLLALFLPYQMAFPTPRWLATFTDQNQQYAEMIQFTKEYLPPNEGVEPGFWTTLPTEGITDRMVAAWYFAGWGWYTVIVAGGLLILSACFSGGARKKEGATVLLVLVGLWITMVAPAFMAEYLQGKGDDHQMQGRYAKALLDYRRALDYDIGISYSPRYHLEVGALYTALSRTDQPEYHFYQGSLLENRGRLREAAFEYAQAQRTDLEGMQHVVSDAISGLHEKTGLDAYRKGHVATALAAWTMALAANPDQTKLHYYRARAFFDSGAYSDAISENQRFLAASANRILNANVYANLGDCHQKLRDPQRAREFYRRSLALDRDQNARAFMSLSGA